MLFRSWILTGAFTHNYWPTAFQSPNYRSAPYACWTISASPGCYWFPVFLPPASGWMYRWRYSTRSWMRSNTSARYYRLCMIRTGSIWPQSAIESSNYTSTALPATRMIPHGLMSSGGRDNANPTAHFKDSHAPMQSALDSGRCLSQTPEYRLKGTLGSEIPPYEC